MVDLFDPRAVALDDDEILSFLRMLSAPDQTAWDYDEPGASMNPLDDQAAAQVVQNFRANFLPNRANCARWARDGREIVGMVGINRFEEPSKAHCAEFGIGVAAAYQRQGIGYRLADAIIAQARAVEIRRLEADCLADNVAVTKLLHKVGFVDEGVRRGAIQKAGRLRDVRLFGLLL